MQGGSAEGRRGKAGSKTGAGVAMSGAVYKRWGNSSHDLSRLALFLGGPTLCIICFTCGALALHILRFGGQSGLEMEGSSNQHSGRHSQGETEVAPPCVQGCPLYSPFGIPSCAGLVPTFDKRFPVSLRPITRLEDIKESTDRLMVVAPRHGLGNALRGYSSAYVYAVLTGRKMVLLHLGPHARAWDGLCAGFKCPFDQVLGFTPDDKKTLFKEFLHNYQYFKLEDTGDYGLGIPKTMFSEEKVAFSSSATHFDGYWHGTNFTQCVLDVFNCQGRGMACVYSRAVRALVLGPTQLLYESLAETVQSTRTVGVLPSKFDFAVHVRTVTAAVEGNDTTDPNCEKELCQSRKKNLMESHLNPATWACIAQEMVRREPRKQGNFSIFLATDSEEHRPFFLEQLRPHGVIYHSAKSIVHTSKTASSVIGLLPTMVEFYLLGRATTILALPLPMANKFSTFAHFAALSGATDNYAKMWPDRNCSFHYDKVQFD